MGKLVLVGTPIGNLEDASPRSLRTLEEADLVACEDSRRTRKLLTHFGIKVKDLAVYNEGNERRKADELVARIEKGATVALVSDAGMPGLSDPGYRLVKACVDRGLPVEVVPGPTASVSALAVSGLPTGRFVFEGFLPRKKGERRRRIEELATERRTIVLFESPHRIVDSLKDLLEGLGDRPAALVRELTKMYEEAQRGTLSELLARAEGEAPRGEIVLVVGGAIHDAKPLPAPDELAARARALMDQGVDRKTALVRVARESGVSKRDVFDALLDGD
ncbi:MAG: 16S rRNA (cytidine(1402)-2'-O)-methyltransferase [Actinobacteria bacterium]|nr:16S rRNA (cytidine(1402)-2'-O)-methyltransferase [Actinomycetota bacterium]